MSGILTLFAVAFGVAVNGGHFQGLIVRYVEARSGRQITVSGPFRAHLFSLHPWVTAEGVVIGNPPWSPPGSTAEIGKLAISMQMPFFGRSFLIENLKLEDAVFHLSRATSERANWQWHDPRQQRRAGVPVIRSIAIPDAHLMLEDARHHLTFDGTVSLQGSAPGQPSSPLRLEAKGRLNGHQAAAELTGDALATWGHAQPYHFAFSLDSSGSQLSGHGVLPEPFYLDTFDAVFAARGDDLRDLFYLTGLSLPNTGSYSLSGTAARRGKISTFSDLEVTSGGSDVRGTLSIDSSEPRSKIDAKLFSKTLRSIDLGTRAAGRASDQEAQFLLSNAPFNPEGMRRVDGVYQVQVQQLEIGRVALQAMSAKITVNDGVLTIEPLAAQLLGGKLAARIRLNANEEPPGVDADLKFSDLDLGKMAAKPSVDPPLEGAMQARIRITGNGRSLHQVAASANGSVVSILSHGTMRASLAELAGVDLRGIGMMIANDKRDTDIRCAAAIFDVRHGVLTAQKITMDTAPVLITGKGTVQLDTESLDLSIEGHPKMLRLFRLHASLALRGSIRHPDAKIEARHLTIVDAGHAQDVDCSALLAEAARAGETTLTPKQITP